jgi:hypothetical protein
VRSRVDESTGVLSVLSLSFSLFPQVLGKKQCVQSRVDREVSAGSTRFRAEQERV